MANNLPKFTSENVSGRLAGVCVNAIIPDNYNGTPFFHGMKVCILNIPDENLALLVSPGNPFWVNVCKPPIKDNLPSCLSDYFGLAHPATNDSGG